MNESFRPHYGPGVDSASNRNEYREYFLEGNGGRCVGLTTLPPSCADSLEIWDLNVLEPLGPVQACNGIALPVALTTQDRRIVTLRRHNPGTEWVSNPQPFS